MVTGTWNGKGMESIPFTGTNNSSYAYPPNCITNSQIFMSYLIFHITEPFLNNYAASKAHNFFSKPSFSVSTQRCSSLFSSSNNIFVLIFIAAKHTYHHLQHHSSQPLNHGPPVLLHFISTILFSSPLLPT